MGFDLELFRFLMDRSEMRCSFLSSFNILSRLALGKWAIKEYRHYRYFQTPIGRILFPQDSVPAYYHGVVELASRSEPLIMVPKSVAAALKTRGMFDVSVHDTQYLMRPDHVGALPGARLKRLRNYVSHAGQHSQLTHHNGKSIDAAILRSINDEWYRGAAKRKFRTFEKKHIEWVWYIWPDIRASDPHATITTVQAMFEGRMWMFDIGTRLTPTMGVTYCERYCDDTPRGVNLYALGWHMHFLDCPVVNDGPAHEKSIRDLKEKLSFGKTQTFKVALK